MNTMGIVASLDKLALTTIISTNAIAATAFSVDDICAEWGGKKLESSGFSDNKMLGFYLSRRVQYGNNWHPVDDDLRGTAVYGTPPTNPTYGPTGSIKWNYNDVQYFMFSTGDFSEWYGSVFAWLLCQHRHGLVEYCLNAHTAITRMIIKRDILDTKFGNKKDKQIVCSSKEKSSKNKKQIFRTGTKNKEDPWLSYTDYADSSMMYGENGNSTSVVLLGAI